LKFNGRIFIYTFQSKRENKNKNGIKITSEN